MKLSFELTEKKNREMTCRTMCSDVMLRWKPKRSGSKWFHWLRHDHHPSACCNAGVPGPPGPPGPPGRTGPAGSAGNNEGGGGMTSERGQALTSPTIGPTASAAVTFRQSFSVLPAVIGSSALYPVVPSSVTKTGATFQVSNIQMAANHTFPTSYSPGHRNNQCLTSINGKPAISYFDKLSQQLYFCLASNTEGTQWNMSQPIITRGPGDPVIVSLPHSICVIGSGATAVVGLTYFDDATKSIKYLPSNDLQGVSWPHVDQSTVVDIPGDFSQLLSITLDDVNGSPGVVWHYTTTWGSTFTSVYKFGKQVNSMWDSWVIANTSNNANTMGFMGFNYVESCMNVGYINSTTFVTVAATRSTSTDVFAIVQDVHDSTVWSVVSSGVSLQSISFTRLVRKNPTEYEIYVSSDASKQLLSLKIKSSIPGTLTFDSQTLVDATGILPMRQLRDASSSFAVIENYPALLSASADARTFTYFQPKPVSISYAAFA